MEYATLTTVTDASCGVDGVLDVVGDCVRRCVFEVYCIGGCPQTVHSFMPQDLVVKLFMSSTRDYDACNVSGGAYTFTSKTDSERMWITRVDTV